MPAELKRESVLTKFDLFLQGNTLGLHHCEELGVHLSCQIRPIRTDVERIGEIVQSKGSACKSYSSYCGAATPAGSKYIVYFQRLSRMHRMWLGCVTMF